MRVLPAASSLVLLATVVAVAACSGTEPTSPAQRTSSGPTHVPPIAWRNPYAGHWRGFIVGTSDLGPFTVLADGRFTIGDVAGVITPSGRLSGEIVAPTVQPRGRGTAFQGECPNLDRCDGATIAIGEEPSIVIQLLR